MANTFAPVLIEPPQPPPRPYGLFDVALGPMPLPSPQAGRFGVQYVPDTCESGVFLYAINCPAVTGSKTFSPVEGSITGAPFGVITSYQCGTIGYSFEEAEQRVRTRMTLREQRGVERRVWQGVPAGGIGGIPGLFQSATTLSTTACPTLAIQALEQALASAGVVGGTIHARPNMAAQLARSHLIEKGPGRSVVTQGMGTPVVFGHGYDGTGPAGQAVTNTTEYMYASGRIALWATDIEIIDPRQTLDTTNNVMYVLGEKLYVATVECGVWATQVTYDCTTN